MDKIEKPRNQLEVMFNKAVELEAENKRLRDELKGATRIIDEQDAENQRLRGILVDFWKWYTTEYDPYVDKSIPEDIEIRIEKELSDAIQTEP